MRILIILYGKEDSRGDNPIKEAKDEAQIDVCWIGNTSGGGCSAKVDHKVFTAEKSHAIWLLRRCGIRGTWTWE